MCKDRTPSPHLSKTKRTSTKTGFLSATRSYIENALKFSLIHSGKVSTDRAAQVMTDSRYAGNYWKQRLFAGKLAQTTNISVDIRLSMGTPAEPTTQETFKILYYHGPAQVRKLLQKSIFVAFKSCHVFPFTVHTSEL